MSRSRLKAEEVWETTAMKEMLKAGQFLHQRGLDIIRVDSFIGSGSQGEVYQVSVSKVPMALKWYYPNHATSAQAGLIDRLCQIGPPNEFFLWPTHRITDRNVKGFGYLMPLRPAHYRSIVDLMKRRVDPSFQTLILAALHLTDSFKRLHDKGLCYRDISFGNVFFDHRTGDVLICDNDNIAQETIDNSGVLGTPRFMAPEIVVGAAKPNVASDLYSLSVLLFYLFFVHHPLEGKREAEIRCFDLPAMTKLYGTHPLFIFHPEDASNRPQPKLHENALIYWGIYPRYLKDLFTRAFTAGLLKPESRIPETGWLRGLEKLLASVQHCSCGAENFFEIGRIKDPAAQSRCWSCRLPLGIPLRMRLKDEVMVLSAQAPLFAHQVQPGKRRDYKQLYGQVMRHPADPQKLGLRNLSQESWQVQSPGGRTLTVAEGQTVALESGQTIRFPHLTVEIRQ